MHQILMVTAYDIEKVKSRHSPMDNVLPGATDGFCVATAVIFCKRFTTHEGMSHKMFKNYITDTFRLKYEMSSNVMHIVDTFSFIYKFIYLFIHYFAEEKV